MSARVPHPLALLLVLTLLVGAVAVIQFGGEASLTPTADGPAADASGGSAPATSAGASGAAAGTESADTNGRETTTPLDPADRQRIVAKEAKYERAPELASPTGYVNAEDVSIGQFTGKKVVLVQFWTFGCINCQHTLPYVDAWYDEYHDDGLVVVGVHTPEFDYEKQPENVRAAVEDEGIRYPVVMDNDWATWRAYGVRAWPTQFLVDVDGFVRYKHVGEGRYDQTEAEIQKLLDERRQVLADDGS